MSFVLEFLYELIVETIGEWLFARKRRLALVALAVVVYLVAAYAVGLWPF